MKKVGNLNSRKLFCLAALMLAVSLTLLRKMLTAAATEAPAATQVVTRLG
jgi:hypothetical protein